MGKAAYDLLFYALSMKAVKELIQNVKSRFVNDRVLSQFCKIIVQVRDEIAFQLSSVGKKFRVCVVERLLQKAALTFFDLKTFGSKLQRSSFEEDLIQHAAGTKDHTVSDTFVQLLRTR